jgi:uncharacterized protein YbjT (DUF2867 family)
MKVLVIGANGNTGTRVVHLLKRGGHEPRALIRHVDQKPKFDAMDTETVRGDLEHDVRPALDGCDAVIFTAGSGSRTPPEKTDAVDRDGAIRVIDAAAEAGARRFVMLSAMGADPESRGHEISHYFRAKGVADDHLSSSGLDFTIVRPGRLSNRPAATYIDAATRLGRQGEISRDDLAEVLVACLEMPNTRGKTFEVLTGERPIEKALEAL